MSERSAAIAKRLVDLEQENGRLESLVKNQVQIINGQLREIADQEEEIVELQKKLDGTDCLDERGEDE